MPLTTGVMSAETAASPAETALERGWPSSAPPDPPPSLSGSDHPSGPYPPARLREFVAVAALIALFDLVVYRGHGFAGAAAGFVVAPLLLLLGAPRRQLRWPTLLAATMLLLLAVRAAWLGYPPLIPIGLGLVVAFSATLTGRTPFLPDVAFHALQATFAPIIRLGDYRGRGSRAGVSRDLWLKVLLPAGAVLGFGAIFVLANPDLTTQVETWLERVVETLNRWAGQLDLKFEELVLWGVVAWLSIGLLRPIVPAGLLSWLKVSPPEQVSATASLLPAYRNMLVAVNALFASYLAFESHSLWFREFPAGFYYAGYAHEGAAWLTVALALATLVLSAVFRGTVLQDPRLPLLRKLAWVWSALNFLLAIAVYHRLLIYVDFNGMTRMRTVGFFGVTCVVAGFAWVMLKISRDRDFPWLIQRQLWTLAVALYLLAIWPTDYLVQRYNVSRILRGDLPPAVQITEHPVDNSGYLVLLELLQSGDVTIREGIQGMLAQRHDELQAARRDEHTAHWTAWQWVNSELWRRLEATRGEWDTFAEAGERDAAVERFRKYAYQWY